MKIILSAVLTLVAVGSIAQITLTSTDFANAGDTVRMSQTQTFPYDFTETGPNAVWNFAGLDPNSQTLKGYEPIGSGFGLIQFTYGSFAPTNYQASYSSEATQLPLDMLGAFLPVQLDDIFQYTRVTADSITSIGYSFSANGQGIPAKSDTIETRYNLPLTYQDDHFSRGYTKLNMNPILDATFIQYRTRSTYVDGWGQITTPFGTFPAIRVQHLITEIDSFSYEGQWFGVPVPDTYFYEWWTNGQLEPILRVQTNVVQGDEVVTMTEYRDIYRPELLSISELGAQVNLFPNPTTLILKIKSDQKFDRYDVVDFLGKVVLTIENPEIESEINVSTLMSGTYFLIGTFGLERHSTQFVKQ